MSNEKVKQLNRQEAEWIADLVTDGQQFETTKSQLKMARAQLLAGQRLENWFQVADMFFRQIGIIHFQSFDKLQVKVGHLVDNEAIYLGIYFTLECLSDDLPSAQTNFSRCLLSSGIPLDEKLITETIIQETFTDGKVGTGSRAIMKLSGDGELKEILQGKIWSM